MMNSAKAYLFGYASYIDTLYRRTLYRSSSKVYVLFKSRGNHTSVRSLRTQKLLAALNLIILISGQ